VSIKSKSRIEILVIGLITFFTPHETLDAKYIPELDHPGSLVADGFVTLSNFPPSRLTYYVGDIRGTFLQKCLFKAP